MTTAEKTSITVEAIIKAPAEHVWNLWTDPRHIINWNHASDNWHSPKAENDLREGGRFNYRMESRDGSMGFDFTGTYGRIVPLREINYTMDDNRPATVLFNAHGNQTTVTETFEAESMHPADMQKTGWQAILNNFKTYAEAPGTLQTMHFQVYIEAPAEKVYRSMIDEQSYQQWTAAFDPSSCYEGSWEKGAKILFTGTDKEGNKSGMVSRIKENSPARFISIEHLGLVQNGQEITSGPAVEGWAGALENYTFTEEGSGTLLSIDLDANKEFYGYFVNTWPRALQLLKEMCEV